jgi:hypothetical protein
VIIRRNSIFTYNMTTMLKRAEEGSHKDYVVATKTHWYLFEWSATPPTSITSILERLSILDATMLPRPKFVRHSMEVYQSDRRRANAGNNKGDDARCD